MSFQFDLACAQNGIKFGDYSVGTSVNFLDVTLSLNPACRTYRVVCNTIQAGLRIDYKLYNYMKPTDSGLYLRTESFYPSYVFDPVALSQMLRIMNRNSTGRGKARDLVKLEGD